MAESVVGFILQQLSTLLHQEYAQLRGLREGLEFINYELGTMRAFLRDVEAEHGQNSEFQEWVKQVREAAYDIEDVIDEFILVFARHHRGGRVQNISRVIMTLSARRRISKKINGIKSRVENISTRHKRYASNYDFHRTSTSIAADDNAVRAIRGRAILLEEADLVGIHVRKKELLSQIFDSNSHRKVVSVVGMGGIGKTTLIKRVYEDFDVKKQFHSHAWATISQTFKIELVLMNLIQQLHAEIKVQVPQEVESKDIDSLKVFLKDFLRERRYIIVLDDIWSIDAWEALKYALPDCNYGSRVMLTTRIADVASASCAQHCGYVYTMKALSDEESWTLFCNKLFEDDSCPPHLVNVSRRILKKCEGLPLAIVAICGLLVLKDKNRLEEWERVHHSLGGELEGTGKLDRVKKILLLSYNDLPYYLKGCLLYTSLYPEDFEIIPWHLIQLWISEGFVQEREGMSSTEIAEDYVNELVNRNLLQVVRNEVDGSLEACYIHDLLREIILSKAKEHSIITVVKGRCTEGLENVRRLVIHDFINDAQEDFQSNHLRSLVMFRYIDHMSTSFLVKLLCGKSKLLKVLHLHESPLENIPKEVFKLFSRFTKVTELPAEILRLGKLRELDVFDKDNPGFSAPNEIGRLTSLQHLRFMEADNDEIVREIGKLSQLRRLGITTLRREDGQQMCCSLEKLTNLRDLSVVSENEDEILDLQYSMSLIPRFLQSLLLNGRLEKVPQWVPSLQGLTRLDLINSGLTEDHLECLQVLPNLVFLHLDRAYEGESLCFKAGRFQKLKRLDLVELERLRRVIIEDGAMPHLKNLGMMDCKLVEGLPQGFEKLSQLQNVDLFGMPKELIAEVKRKREEYENYRNIAQIPYILIANWIDGRLESQWL